MRGDAERKCLEAVQRCIFESSPFRNETAYTVSEDEFFENYYLYAKPVGQIFFGMSEEDKICFENVLRLVKPNKQLSKFPDFKSDRGLIEHFRVSSSEITKRSGALHQKEYAQFLKNTNKAEQQFMDELNGSPNFGEEKSTTNIFTYPPHSYDFFCESFKKTWAHHIDGVKKYDGCKDVTIFMVEYQDNALHMHENLEGLHLKETIVYGDMLNGEKYSYYRLSRDKDILTYIYGYKDIVDYVVMVTDELPEVIKVENIPELLKLNPNGFVIGALSNIHEVHYFAGMSIPMEKGREKIDEQN